jgi:hypothetical protein
MRWFYLVSTDGREWLGQASDADAAMLLSGILAPMHWHVVRPY